MSFSIEAFLEGEIYLDTMMFYVFLRAEEKVRSIIGGFFERIEKGMITAYTEDWLFELGQQ